LVQQLRSRQQLLGEALQHSSPDAQTVGQLLIESRAIEQSIDSVRRQANVSFEQVLTDDQRQRLQHIRSASQVCPIVPALQATGLL